MGAVIKLSAYSKLKCNTSLARNLRAVFNCYNSQVCCSCNCHFFFPTFIAWYLLFFPKPSQQQVWPNKYCKMFPFLNVWSVKHHKTLMCTKQFHMVHIQLANRSPIYTPCQDVYQWSNTCHQLAYSPILYYYKNIHTIITFQTIMLFHLSHQQISIPRWTFPQARPDNHLALFWVLFCSHSWDTHWN